MPATFPAPALGFFLFKTEVILHLCLRRAQRTLLRRWDGREKASERPSSPSCSFAPNISELFTSSYPKLPLQFHSLQFILHPGGDNTCLALSMFRLEHHLNVRPGHRAHRGKDFQTQRGLENKSQKHEALSLHHPREINLLCKGDNLNSLATPTAGAQPQIQ